MRRSERGALAPRSLSHLPTRLRNAENTHKFLPPRYGTSLLYPVAFWLFFRYIERVFCFTGLLDLLCPPLCFVCGEVIENASREGESICPTCVQKIVTPDGLFCRRCGGRQLVIASNPNECARCRTVSFRFKKAISLGEYKNDLRKLVLRMKTDRFGILALSAARSLAIHRRTDLEEVQADYIVPVPMHRYRREYRGVNAPDLLAEELGQRLKVPVAKHFLRRIRQTHLQFTLSQQARSENVSGAFALRSSNFWTRLSLRRSVPAAPLLGKTVLLVDDILTTGSTCNEITKVLLSAGAHSVTVAIVARAVGNLYRREG